MPGATCFGHELQNPAVLENEVVRRDLGKRVAEPLESLTSVRHAGVVQNENVRNAAIPSLPVIGRWKDLGRHRTVRRQPLAHAILTTRPIRSGAAEHRPKPFSTPSKSSLARNSLPGGIDRG